jgi:excisionase family DNA binding protein
MEAHLRANVVELKTEKPKKLLLTIDESCESGNFSRATFYKLVHQGQIKIVKIGRASRVRPADLEALIDRLAAR